MAIPKLDLDKFKKQSLTSKSQYDPAKQVEGYKKRLSLSGIDPEEATDSRNWLEKLLNLTPDQNVLFDVFEILERPQQALFGAWKAKQEGKDVKKALKAGITGNDVVRFKEILHNYGMSDSAEKFGADDVVGFLGDVLIDPIDIPLMPYKAGTKTVDILTDAVKQADDVLRAAKKAGKVGADLLPATKKLVKAEKALQKASKVRMIAPIEGLFKTVKAGGKATVKLTDNTITKILNKIDNISKESPDVLNGVKKALTTADDYVEVKKRMTQIFNAAKELPGDVMRTFRKNLGKTEWTKKELKLMFTHWNESFENFYKVNGSQLGFKTKEEFGEAVQGIIEYSKYKPTTTFDEIFMQEVASTMAFDEKTKAKTMEFLDEYLPNVHKEKDLFKKVPGDIDLYEFNPDRIGDIKKSLKKLDEQSGIIQKLDEKIASPRFYTDEQIKKYELLSQNKEFMNFVNETEGLMNDMLSKIDENLGTAMATGTPEGYLPHVMTKERQALKPKNKITKGTMFDDTALKGNVNKYTGRKYRMSAEEANAVYQTKIKQALDNGNLSDAKKEFWKSNQGMKIFETSVNASLDDFIESAPGFAKDIKQLDDVLIPAFLADNDILRAVGDNEKIGMTHTKISRTDVEKKLRGFKKYVPEETAKRFDDMIAQLPKSNVLAMDKTVYEMIGRLGNQKEISKFVNLLDFINNSFKKFKLLSPGFQMRNWVGNSSNMYLAGMDVPDILSNYKKADNIFKKAPEIVEKATMKGVDVLTEAEAEIYKIYREFVENGFHDISKEVWDVEKIITDKKLPKKSKDPIKNLSEWNFAMNQKADERFRLAALMWAKENPKAYAKMGLDSPESFVRQVLFDPKDLSGFERDTLKRLVPFYTFTKKNLAYQMKNIFNNPRKYNHLRKTIRGMWDAFADIDINDIESYKKENSWIPVPFINKDGKYAAIKTNLPFGDLAELLEHPGRKVLASMSPAIRAPFEIATNKQIYTDMPISEFEGQKGYTLPGLSRKAEYGLGQFGLDVPLALGVDIGRTGLQAARGELQGQSGMDIIRQSVGRSIFSAGSVEKAQRSKAYEELRQVQELLKYYKQEDIDILTLAEAENKNNTISSLTAKLKSLLG